MTETHQHKTCGASCDGEVKPDGGFLSRVDKTWVAFAVIAALVGVLDYPQLLPLLWFTIKALASTAPFILFAVLAVAYLKATGAEALLARAFEGRELKMILFAALLGGLSPFCSCEVIPFIAAMLAFGAPLSAVMAFWLASPLMDPAMFLIISGTLGWEFAIAKAIAAVAIGLAGGLMTKWAGKTMIFANPLRTDSALANSCGTSPFSGEPLWQFWNDGERRQVFGKTAWENLLFLGKWLAIAYLIEGIMLHYVPAEWIARAVGGEGIWPIINGALVGLPAYLNGYAAVPLVDALLTQGMSNGASMSFMIAGGISCIPAALAVWALVKPRVFAAYIGFAFIGAIIAGLAWQAVA